MRIFLILGGVSLTESYVTALGCSRAEYTEKRSRFIANLAHCETEGEAAEFINTIKAKHREARHNCYAYSVEAGALRRFSDDGEPHGTAGKPILSAIDGAGLTNVCIVVTRYFGGVLLGTGGLVRAYSKAASAAAETAERAVMTLGTVFSCTCDYSEAERLARLIADCGGDNTSAEYTERVKYSFFLRETEKSGFLEKLREGFGARIAAEEIKTEERPVKAK